MTPLALLMTFLLGQTDSPAELSPIQVTAGRHEASVFDSSKAVSVVDRERLELATPSIAADLLRGVPGVFVQQTTPGQGIPIVRGLKGSENLHLVDGFRLNNAFFRNAPNQYLSLVEPSNLERLEVLRGPASTLYGSDALGGVVQLITRKPEFESGTRYGTRAFLASADETVSLSGSIENGTATHAWRIQAAWQDSGNRETGAGEIGPSGFESNSLNGSYRRRVGDHLEWSLDVQFTRQPSTPRVDELVPGFGQIESDSEAFFFEPNERTFVHGTLGGDDLPWFDNWQVHLGYQEIRDDRRSRNRGSSEERLEANTSELVGLTAQFDRRLDRVNLVYGLEYYDDKVTSRRIGRHIDTGLERDLISRFPTGSTQRSTAAYLSAEFHPGIADQITLGGRYSQFDIDLSQADGAAGGKLSPDEFTLSVGWLRELAEGWHLTANAGEGFRAPNIFDLSTLGERPGNRFNVANPDLGPEQLKSADLGIKWRSSAVQAELFGFFSRFEDKITSVATGELTPEGRMIVRSENVAEVDLYGIEFGARWFARDDLEGFATLNWVRGQENQRSGPSRPADRVPPFNGRLGMTWQVDQRWSIEGWSDFAGRQDRLSDRDIDDPRINPLGTSGWATLNVRVDVDVSPELRLGFGVENLLDRAYREHGSGIDAPGLNAKMLISASW